MTPPYGRSNHELPNPVELLQKLIRFDTTNPPGNEAECISFVNNLLVAAGFQTKIVAAEPSRPNLIARLEGRGTAPPLMFYGHVDVVTTADQDWTHPPFGGDIINGYVWGRGALDMKGGVAMMVSAVLRAKSERLKPAGDIILAILSDEERGGDIGAKFLVEHHPELFQGIRYGIGEFGGFSMDVAGCRFYPIQVDEKQPCWTKVTLRGPGGHGSRPIRGGAMAKLGRMLTQLDERRLPIRITSVPRMMIETMGRELPSPEGPLLLELLNPDRTELALQSLKEHGDFFEPLLRNTVNPTVVSGGHKVNVIPSHIELELDARLVPGCDPDDFISELQEIIGNDIELDITKYDGHPGELDMGLFDTLADLVREADPGSVPLPYLLAGATDGRFFARLGIQSYGFMPMKLPSDFRFMTTIHAADERIPVETVRFGSDVLYALLERYNA